MVDLMMSAGAFGCKSLFEESRRWGDWRCPGKPNQIVGPCSRDRPRLARAFRCKLVELWHEDGYSCHEEPRRVECPGDMEAGAGVRDDLLRVGIDFSGDSNRGARSAAVFACGDAVFGCRRVAVWMADLARGAIAACARMGIGISAGALHFRVGLRIRILGRTARAFWSYSSDVGDDSCVHGAFRDYFSANAETYVAIGAGAADRPRWSCGPDEPFDAIGRSEERRVGK